MITLYDHPLSPYAQKVKIALREKGLAYEAPMPGGLGAGGAQGAFVEASPRAEVPALVDGEVRKLDPEKGLIVLKHGDLPNLGMPPMTMGFDVTDKKMLKGLKVGDKVKFQAQMIGGKATVTELKR